jgi:glycerate dehydrogenase
MSCRYTHGCDSTTAARRAKLSLLCRNLYPWAMNICVLDGFTLNPGDLNWEELQQLGPCEIHDRTLPAEIIARAAHTKIMLTNKTPLTRETIAALPRLKYIGVLATGTNAVDLAAARERNIPVTNVPAYSTRSVAQATIALLLELTNHVGHHSQRVRAGGWTRATDWCFWDFSLVELDGLTMGVMGFGRIGAAVADIAHALGMQVIAHNTSQKPAPPFVKFVDLETLFRTSDVVSLHCPLTPQTQQLVNAERLAWMKPSAFLLNPSRGPLVDEAALAEALNSGRLAGAALDVLAIEPPPASNPLLSAKNCLITPHNAWGTRAARARLMRVAVDNVRAFLAGTPQNVVN